MFHFDGSGAHSLRCGRYSFAASRLRIAKIVLEEDYVVPGFMDALRGRQKSNPRRRTDRTPPPRPTETGSTSSSIGPAAQRSETPRLRRRDLLLTVRASHRNTQGECIYRPIRAHRGSQSCRPKEGMKHANSRRVALEHTTRESRRKIRYGR